LELVVLPLGQTHGNALENLHHDCPDKDGKENVRRGGYQECKEAKVKSASFREDIGLTCVSVGGRVAREGKEPFTLTNEQ